MEGKLKYLLQALKTYQKEAVLAPLFKLSEACMELLVPLVVARIVDVGIAAGDKTYIVCGVLLLVAFGAAGLCFAIIAQYFAAKAAVGVSAEMRSRLFKRLQSLSYEDIDGIGTSRMITLMTSDITQVQAGVNHTLRLLLRSPIIVIGAAVMAFFVDVYAGLVFLVLIPLLTAVIIGVMCASAPLYKKVQEKLDGVNLSVRENLQGVRVIRAFCREEKELADFDGRNADLCAAQKRAGRISAVTNPLTFCFVNLAVILLVFVGGMRVGAGALEQGDVIALYFYITIILTELIKFANCIYIVAKAVSADRRIEEVLALPAEPDRFLCGTDGMPVGGEEDGEIAVSFENVSFTYRGGGAASLADITFAVKKGETVGILGGTGAGKSTLVNLIPRFYRAGAGTVKVNGVNVDAVSKEKLRSDVAVVPQKTLIFQGTVRSNLLWGNGAATDEDLLRAVGIAQAGDILAAKGGLDGKIAQEGKNLSGGQRQRLSIVRAIAGNPQILILDDSSSALDYATDARLRAALKTLGCTTFIVSQRTASVRHADKIIVLEEGRIAGIGTHAELLKNCNLYREIDASQGGGEA